MRRQGRIQGWVLGVKTPTFLGIFHSLEGFFKKKITNPSLEKFLDTPLLGGIVFLRDVNYKRSLNWFLIFSISFISNARI